MALTQTISELPLQVFCKLFKWSNRIAKHMERRYKVTDVSFGVFANAQIDGYFERNDSSGLRAPGGIPGIDCTHPRGRE
jgi:hypothetical protein